METGQVDPRMPDRWLQTVIESAARAPSSHNTQPWQFRLEEGGVSLHADLHRRLPVNDPSDRELAISCGCALMNLRIAAAAAGRAYRLELLPEGEDSPCLARISWEDGDPDAGEAGLAPAIERRRTCRQRFASSAVPDSEVTALLAMAGREGARLQALESLERRAVAGLVAEGDGIQWRDSRWRHELAAWIHPRSRGEGLTVPSWVAPLARFAVKTFDMGRRLAGHDRQLAENAPRLLVLWTDGDQPHDWLRAGQALERVLLAACASGLQASYLNQPLQVASLRPRLRQALGEGNGHPQIVLRLGYPPRDLPKTPRRAWADMLQSPSG